MEASSVTRTPGAMGFGFHELIAHAAYSRTLSAGTIIGSGTISNENYRTVGSACITERRGIAKSWIPARPAPPT